MNKVSVIIPAYNVEKYIYRAIESVLHQTYLNIELVIVDDGSTDNTWNIIKKYMSQDSRIIAETQKNKGVSAARNLGLSLSNGKFVTFLDSDDWLEPDAISYLMEMSKQNIGYLPIVDRYFAFIPDDKQNIIKEPQRKEVPCTIVSLDEALINIGNGKYNLQSACYKLFDKDVLLDKKIIFNEKYFHGEDGLFVFYYMINCKGIYFSTKPLWNILERPGSATTSPYNKKWLTAINAAEEMMKCEMVSSKMTYYLIGNVVDRIEMVEHAAVLNSRDNKDDILFAKEKLKIYFNEYKLFTRSSKDILKYLIYRFCPISLLEIIVKIKE